MQLILDARAIEDPPEKECDVWGSKSAGKSKEHIIFSSKA